MEILDKSLQFIIGKLKAIGAFFLFGMAVLTCADIIGRLFKHPIFGAVELVSFMAVLVIAAGMPVIQAEKGHIGVELFVGKLPKKLQLIIDLLTETISFGLFVIISWRLFLFSLKTKENGEVSMNLHLPEYVIVFILACCSAILCLIILSSIVTIFRKLRRS